MATGNSINPNDTFVGRLKHKKTMGLMAVLAGIGTLGAAIVALNALTGLNLRPAWGFEVDALKQQQMRVEELLEKSGKQTEISARRILELNRSQLEIRIQQIESDRREARRELTQLKLQAEKEHESNGRIPSFITRGISDLNERIRIMDETKASAQSRLLELQ